MRKAEIKNLRRMVPEPPPLHRQEIEISNGKYYLHTLRKRGDNEPFSFVWPKDGKEISEEEALKLKAEGVPIRQGLSFV